MGILSCFHGGLAWTHHAVLQLAAIKAGKSIPFLNYVIRGDDVVIFDEIVALTYESIMVKEGKDGLSMVISRHKSLIGTSFEFSKAIWCKGTSIGPLPVCLVNKARMYEGFLPTLLRDLSTRYHFTEAKLSTLMSFIPPRRWAKGYALLTNPTITKVTRIEPPLKGKTSWNLSHHSFDDYHRL